jgi:hypothetical protein
MSVAVLQISTTQKSCDCHTTPDPDRSSGRIEEMTNAEEKMRGGGMRSIEEKRNGEGKIRSKGWKLNVVKLVRDMSYYVP